MKKLEINYDFIDKIYESKGKYKIKRFINNNKFTDAIIAGFVTKDIILGASGILSPEQTVAKVTSYLATMSVIILLLESINQKLKERLTGKTQEERAEEELRKLALQLNNLNISVNLEDLKEAVIYHKKYRLRKDGKPGIIRERYIEVPILDINFDVIDKTYEARGQHNVRRWFRVNKVYDVAGAIIPATHLALTIIGVEPPEEALIRSLISVGTNFGFWASLDVALSSLKTKLSGLGYKERAYIELMILSQILSKNGINISVNQMMEAEVYHKKYKLSKEGTPGIIRERYFEVNMTDQLGDEKPTSIKEEHLLGSRKYRLSFDKPAEQRQYRLAYNM